MSAHPQDLSAPHMDRVQLVMSWYTDGPGGGTEWYRMVQSGTQMDLVVVQSGTAADDEWWSLGGIRPPAHTTASKNSQTNFGHRHIFA